VYGLAPDSPVHAPFDWYLPSPFMLPARRPGQSFTVVHSLFFFFFRISTVLVTGMTGQRCFSLLRSTPVYCLFLDELPVRYLTDCSLLCAKGSGTWSYSVAEMEASAILDFSPDQRWGQIEYVCPPPCPLVSSILLLRMLSRLGGPVFLYAVNLSTILCTTPSLEKVWLFAHFSRNCGC